MPVYSFHRNACKYSAYLSETFQTLELFPEIIDQITRAGLFYISAEKTFGTQLSLDEIIQQGMRDADIFILYCGDHLDDIRQFRGKPIAELEYNAAKAAGIPILVYLCGDFADESSGSMEWIESIRENETYYMVSDEEQLPFIVTSDLLKLIITEPSLSFWIRSNINPAKVELIVQQKNTIDNHLLQAGYYIQLYEKNLEAQEHDQIIGPLIDIGLRPNIGGQAYRFASKQLPLKEMKHDELAFQYCIDRFTPYEGGAVYDQLLDITWLIIDNQNFSWQDAMDWKKCLNPHNLNRIEAFQGSGIAGAENDWRLPPIEELMTLITDRKQGEDFFDKNLFPGDVHWFWSSTLVKDEKKAFYIETTQGSVLKDELNHLNAILLCCDGVPKKLGKRLHIAVAQTPEKETEILRRTNSSRHIYGVLFVDLQIRAQV